MTAPKKLSATMADAIDRIRDKGGVIEAWRGGWWTYPGCPVARKSIDGYDVPEWSIGTQTVRALRERGLLEFTKSTRTDGSGMPIGGRLKEGATA
jgi:hypothetical protein